MNGLNICPKCLVVIGQYGQCNCNSRRPAWASLLRLLRLLTVIAVLTFGAYATAPFDYCDDHPEAPECEDIEDWPIIGPGPCHSDTIWGCYPHHLWLPSVAS